MTLRTVLSSQLLLKFDVLRDKLLAQIVVNVNRPIFPPAMLVQRRKAHSQCLAIQPARVPRGCRFAISQLTVAALNIAGSSSETGT
jgi:hypothetical protein